MKVYCVNFQGIAEGQRTNALVQGMFNMFRRLDPEKYIFLNSSVDKNYGPNIHGLSNKQLVVYNLFSKITARLNVPYYIRRTIQEKIIDYYLCKVLKKEKKPFILISTMYAVRCTRYARQRGCKVVFWAGNLNDNLYYDTVKNEQKRLGLKYTDVYSSDYRINVYRKMFENIDYVWCLNRIIAWSFEGKNTILDPRERKREKILYQKKYNEDVPDKIKIGYFGHTTLLKGVHQLPEAASICKHKNDIEFIIAGNVDEYVKSIINKYNIKVTYLGPVAESKKWDVIQSFDYMIIPSLYDAGPMTISEAFWCDVPAIISSGCGGVDRVKDDPKSIIFETMNIQDLADKIDYAYEHRYEYLKASDLNKVPVEDLNAPKDYNFFTDIIEKL